MVNTGRAFDRPAYITPPGFGHSVPAYGSNIPIVMDFSDMVNDYYTDGKKKFNESFLIFENHWKLGLIFPSTNLKQFFGFLSEEINHDIDNPTPEQLKSWWMATITLTSSQS